MMDWKNIALILVAGFNLGSALMVYFLNPKSKINIYYSLMVLCTAIWIFGLATFRLMQTMMGINFLIFIYYSSAALISFFLYMFSIYVPYQKRLLKIGNKMLVSIGLIIIIVASLPQFLVSNIILDPPNSIVNLNMIGGLIYALVFLFFIIAGFKNLIEKYLENAGFYRKQLQYFIFCR